MLRSLHIRNYVLIDSLDIEFPEGLVIITGQTGAGKSILLGALSLLSGTKADASLISKGAQSCVVEAEFVMPDDSPLLRALLEENEAEWDEGRITVRRVVNVSGRSRSFINDSPVNVGVLEELSSLLIDIHSQHRSLLLTDHEYQLSALDRHAGNGIMLEECRSCWRRMQDVRRELETVCDRLRRASAEQGYNEAQFNELDAVALRDGEQEELEEEQQALENAEQILENLASAGRLFDSGESDRSLGGSLREAERLISKVSTYLPSLEPLCSRLESARIEIEDIESEIEDAAGRVVVSGERLRIVSDRLSLLYSLMAKHGCRSVAELIALRDRYSEDLFDTTSLREREEELSCELRSAEAEWQKAAAALHDARSAAAPGFAASITESLHFLELDRAAFDVAVSGRPGSADGIDSVAFMFSASGEDLQDVAKCASGGELSRIMLSLKALMARTGDMPTMIFDEIDTGVSGSVADRMGSMICSMGEDMQIFSITHLPQVAAKGRAHYVVSKHFDDESGRAVSGIREVTGEERVAEIARLLSGATVTPEAIANARALLSE